MDNLLEICTFQEIDRLRSSELPELRAELGRLEESETTARCVSEEAQLEANSLTVEERRAPLVPQTQHGQLSRTVHH